MMRKRKRIGGKRTGEKEEGVRGGEGVINLWVPAELLLINE